MICRSCGREINNEAKFCPYCGMDPMVPIGSGGPGAPAPGPSAYTGPEAPVKKKKTGLLIGAAAALVAVIALIAVAVTGLFSNPKGQVERALAHSIAAYTAAEESLGMPDISQWQRERSIFQSMTLELRDINSQLVGYDLSALSGLGIEASAGYSMEQRHMTAEARVYWGSDELLRFRALADDDELYFQSPQFAGETYYGVNTETLGADLTEMTGDDSMADVSFNLFELMEIVLDQMDPEGMEAATQDAGRALWEAAQVKKAGAKTLDLNGSETKTTLYHVTIPRQALERYVDDMMDAMSSINYSELYEELFRAMGMPREELEDFLDSLKDLDPYDRLGGALKDALEDFGDLELDVCLSGGYVSAVLYEGELWDEDVELAVYLGGGEAYVDDLSMELRTDGLEVTLKSSGDHGLKGGVYTDETAVQVRQYGTSVAKITSQLSYDPGRTGDNLQWELGVISSGLSLFGLEVQGSLHVDGDTFDLTVEDAACKVMEMEVCSLRFGYQVSRGQNLPEQSPEDFRLITEMSMMELMTFASELERSANIWAANMQALFMARLPQELLGAIMY